MGCNQSLQRKTSCVPSFAPGHARFRSCATCVGQYVVLRCRRSNFQNILPQTLLCASWSQAFADPETSKSNQANIHKHLASHSKLRQSTAANTGYKSQPGAEIAERPDARIRESLQHRPVSVLLGVHLNPA